MKTILSLLSILTLASCTSTSTTSTPSSAAVIPYPLKTCIVSENELGTMGDVVTQTYKGREIKFCCAPCVAKFNKNPEKYVAKLR